MKDSDSKMAWKTWSVDFVHFAEKIRGKLATLTVVTLKGVFHYMLEVVVSEFTTNCVITISP